ncbi:hypothetical protein PGQ11_010889 [Apiospora arundinis]|uniref:Uncharacterized protein n=1 Tax=Apiospora arundinis TaxID=335852 RepID=A0ABR2IB26_9PEZI
MDIQKITAAHVDPRRHIDDKMGFTEEKFREVEQKVAADIYLDHIKTKPIPSDNTAFFPMWNAIIVWTLPSEEEAASQPRRTLATPMTIISLQNRLVYEEDVMLRGEAYAKPNWSKAFCNNLQTLVLGSPCHYDLKLLGWFIRYDAACNGDDRRRMPFQDHGQLNAFLDDVAAQAACNDGRSIAELHGAVRTTYIKNGWPLPWESDVMLEIEAINRRALNGQPGKLRHASEVAVFYQVGPAHLTRVKKAFDGTKASDDARKFREVDELAQIRKEARAGRRYALSQSKKEDLDTLRHLALLDDHVWLEKWKVHRGEERGDEDPSAEEPQRPAASNNKPTPTETRVPKESVRLRKIKATLHGEPAEELEGDEDDRRGGDLIPDDFDANNFDDGNAGNNAGNAGNAGDNAGNNAGNSAGGNSNASKEREEEKEREKMDEELNILKEQIKRHEQEVEKMKKEMEDMAKKHTAEIKAKDESFNTGLQTRLNMASDHNQRINTLKEEHHTRELNLIQEQRTREDHQKAVHKAEEKSLKSASEAREQNLRDVHEKDLRHLRDQKSTLQEDLTRERTTNEQLRQQKSKLEEGNKELDRRAAKLGQEKLQLEAQHAKEKREAGVRATQLQEENQRLQGVKAEAERMATAWQKEKLQLQAQLEDAKKKQGGGTNLRVTSVLAKQASSQLKRAHEQVKSMAQGQGEAPQVALATSQAAQTTQGAGVKSEYVTPGEWKEYMGGILQRVERQISENNELWTRKRAREEEAKEEEAHKLDYLESTKQSSYPPNALDLDRVLRPAKKRKREDPRGVKELKAIDFTHHEIDVPDLDLMCMTQTARDLYKKP